MSNTLTVAELAEAVASRADERELLLRRIRHWTLAGAIVPSTAIHGGTGRHRRYLPETAYLVIVLHYLADWGLPIGVLKATSEMIRLALESDDPSYREKWGRAVAGLPPPVFLDFTPWGAPDRGANSDGTGVEMVLSIIDATQLVERIPTLTEGAVLNLSTIFRDVRL